MKLKDYLENKFKMSRIKLKTCELICNVENKVEIPHQEKNRNFKNKFKTMLRKKFKK